MEVRVTDPITGGQKGTKPERFALIPFDALAEIARVYAFGATKYEDHNWLKGYKWSLSADALLRHVSAFMQGEDRDAESGCLHMAHAAWHCLTLLAFKLRGRGTDDRPPPAYAPRPAAPAPAKWVPRYNERVRVVDRGDYFGGCVGSVVFVDEINGVLDPNDPNDVKVQLDKTPGGSFDECVWFPHESLEPVNP